MTTRTRGPQSAMITAIAVSLLASASSTTVLPQIADDPALHAPLISVVRDLLPSNLEGDDTPVAFMHGMGDAGANPGMQSLAQTVTEAFPNKFSVALSVADGLASILEPMDHQLAEFARAVRAHPQLTGGFDAVGLSQGNLVVRAYIERINDPPVRRFISICGPMEGIGTCPMNPLYQAICPLWKLDKYGANIAFSGYWKDANNKEEYLSKNVFLPDINNERAAKNATYKANMLRLERYVLVEATVDTMLVPRETSHHGFWDWGDEWGHVVPLEASAGFEGDWIGLRTLAATGRLEKLTFSGDHLRFTSEWWTKNILPVFAGDGGRKLPEAAMGIPSTISAEA